MALLQWIAEREDDFPGSPLRGDTLMQEASGLAGSDGLPWEAVAKAAARLKRRGYLYWEYDLWPSESAAPGPEFIDEQNFQRTREIHVTGLGLQALAASRQSSGGTTVNIVGSTVGQLALGDMSNINLSVLIEATDKALDQIQAPEEVKQEARGVLQRIRAVGTSTLQPAVSGVLATAIQRALGL